MPLAAKVTTLRLDSKIKGAVNAAFDCSLPVVVVPVFVDVNSSPPDIENVVPVGTFHLEILIELPGKSSPKIKVLVMLLAAVAAIFP